MLALQIFVQGKEKSQHFSGGVICSHHTHASEAMNNWTISAVAVCERYETAKNVSVDGNQQALAWFCWLKTWDWTQGEH